MSKLIYEKPQIQFWTAAELDEVEATMSSTGSGTTADMGSVGTAPAPYQWLKRGLRTSSTRTDAKELVDMTALIISLACSGLGMEASAAATVITSAAGGIAKNYIDHHINDIYYKARWYELCRNASWNTPMKPTYDPVGYATHTLFYEDSNYSKLIGDITCNDLDSGFQYLMSYLPIDHKKA